MRVTTGIFLFFLRNRTQKSYPVALFLGWDEGGVSTKHPLIAFHPKTSVRIALGDASMSTTDVCRRTNLSFVRLRLRRVVGTCRSCACIHAQTHELEVN